MPTDGQLRGVYNIVEHGTYDTFPTQLPIEAFEELLAEGDVPNQVTVVNLGEAFTDQEFINSLAKTMADHGNALATAETQPIIQFVVQGEIHRGEPFDLFIDGEIHSLRPLFGRQMQALTDDHSWLKAPF
ncbi:hypothetical protein [Halosegnis longus]|uniref:hypothetical protein n=1 Tax=Halosegnis longus TaxID=2216012 RepID=UPI00129EAFA7|nr:hypothetical protein [Halosegnis longus]